MQLSGISKIDNQRWKARIPLVFEADLSSGGRPGLRWGDHGLAPALEVTGTVQLNNVQTGLVQPYVNHFVNVRSQVAGALTLSADVTHNPEQLLAAKGSLTYAAFEVQDRLLEEKLAAWDSLQVDRFELNMAGKTLATSEFKFGGLYGRVTIAKDLTTNVGDLLVTTPDNGRGNGQHIGAGSGPCRNSPSQLVALSCKIPPWISPTVVAPAL